MNHLFYCIKVIGPKKSTNEGSLIPPNRENATIWVAYYPFMASIPQWELPHTKVEQAHRTVGL